MINRLLKNKVQTYIAFAYDLTVATLAFNLAWELRGDYQKPQNYLIILFLAVLSQSITFIFSGLYKGIWRFSSTPDLIRVIKGVSTGVLLSMATLFLYNRLLDIPRTIFLIDWFILVVALGSGRFSYRLWKDNNSYSRTGPRALIIGAGDAGDQLLREIRGNQNVQLQIVGFLDDDKRKVGKMLQGINILGTISEIDTIIKKYQIERIILAIPSATSEQIKRIFDFCNSTSIELQTLPSISHILDGRVQLSLLRNISPEDLLGREIVNLDVNLLGGMLTDKIILITGAGGSIGSELSEQIARFNPKLLILLDISELFLYNLENTFKEKFPKLNLHFIIADVKNIERVRSLFETFKPQVVFHAAAYKHVPMMEKNPIEAVMNNIGGTRNICELCKVYQVERMVLVSTDKAVNPTNVMGTTKRVAEMICQYYHLKSQSTKFMVVRFGNVLGSNGSVIPRFRQQIESGGPVTVTHPEITRFFMSIPEASQLIMQAGSMGQGGEIFILEMGKPIKITELAESMIQMAGLVPHKDIKITFIGLRPGEKLYEELLATNEHSLPTHHAKVKVATQRELPKDFDHKLMHLLSAHATVEEYNIRSELKYLVPELHDSKVIF